MLPKSRILFVLLTAIMVAVLAACGRSSDESSASSKSASDAASAGSMVDEPIDPSTLSGDIATAGSSTVFPLSEAVVQIFIEDGYGGNITIDSIGSGAGFERFCVAGESDVSNASRPIKESERESCAAIDRDPIEIRVGTDALAVVVNPENTIVTDVTMEQVAALFTAEKWSDVDPSWPDEAIERFIPGTDSGTFDYFVEEVFHEDKEPILSAPTTQLSEDDNVLVQGISGSTYAIGFFGYAYYQENADLLSLLNINGVEPSAASVEDGSYALARPLLIYSDVGVIAEKPQVGGFLKYYLENVNDVIINVGYFPAAEDTLNAGIDSVVAAMRE